MLSHILTYHSMEKPNLSTINDVISYAGDTFLRLTAYSGNDVLGCGISTFLNKILKLSCSYEELIRTQKVKSAFIFTKDLEVREVMIEITICENRAQKDFYFLEVPGSRLELKLPLAYKMITDNHIGVAIFSPIDYTLLKINGKYLELLREPFNRKENLIGYKFHDLLPYYISTDDEHELRKAINNGQSLYLKELEGATPFLPGRCLDSQLIPISINGKPKYVVSLISDVTEKVMARKQLEEKSDIIIRQKEQLEAVIESMDEGMFITDSLGRFIFLNAVARKIADEKKSFDEMTIGREYSDLDGNSIPLEQMPAHRALKGEKVKNCEVVIKTKTYETIASFNSIPVFDIDGNIIMTVSSSHDITDIINKEKAIKQQNEQLQAHREQLLKAEIEKNDALEKAIAMKDEFLSLISHELKTPIAVIDSAVQAIEHICSNEISDKLKVFINNIKHNSYRQLRLVNNLLDVTRVNAGRYKLIKQNLDIVLLSKVITDSVSLYAREKGIKLFFTSAAESIVVGIDEEKYERILLNLLSNAIKFTPRGKSVTVKVASKKDNVIISVKDQGLGIPEDKLDIIFERFGQVDNTLSRQAEGTGIGLYLVKLFVKILGGSISVKSKLGRGSTFTLLLPAVRVSENNTEKSMASLIDKQLIQSTAIEFSDIYLP